MAILREKIPDYDRRVAIGAAIEAELKATERRGRPKADNGQAGLLEQEIDQNFGQLKGARSYEVAAEKSGFGNAETYRQAKAVVAAKPTRQARSL